MSIELHCPKCSKLIRAPKEAGGKHGKCPYCKGKVYVPMPEDEIEILGIEPIDEEAERRESELRQESARYAATVASETAGEGGKTGATGAPRAPKPAPGEVVDIGAEVTAFIVALRDGQLDKADTVAAKLKSAGSRARDHVEGLILDEMPPVVENVPPPVLMGFLKQLQGRL